MTALAIILLTLILISVVVGFYALVKQQGRILLRLDQLERNAKVAAAGAEDVSEEAEPAGLALATDFPAFQFPDLTGKTVALKDFRGKRVLLVHWNFECGFCDSIAPDLAALETGLEKANVALVLLAYGDAASNQKQAAEHGMKSRLLLMKDDRSPEPFSQQGTPVGYLLDEAGRVDAPLASGADRVLSLAKALVTSRGEDILSRSAAHPGFGDEPRTSINRPGQPLSEPWPRALPSQPAPTDTARQHRIKLPGFRVNGEIGLGDVIKRFTSALGIKHCVGCERRAALLNRWVSFAGVTGNGLKAGEPAPVFSLPDLRGRMISLEDYRGQRVLLVFTDPQCGPCDELAPDLVRLHREHTNNGLSLIMVGRGDQLENRRKAAQHGVQFPVVIQPKWKLAKEYGTYATPAGFLIGEDGVITSEAALGKDAILALAGLALGPHSKPLAPGFVVGPSPVTGPRGAKET